MENAYILLHIKYLFFHVTLSRVKAPNSAVNINQRSNNTEKIT